MKRFVAFLLLICLTLGIAATALAKPQFVSQPEPKQKLPIKKNGTLTIKSKIKDASGITWVFVNPQNGEETTARNIKKVFPKLVVQGANKANLTLKRIPAEMHGWKVFCRISANGYKVESQPITILIEGMEAPVQSGTDSSEGTPSGDDGEETGEPAPAATAAPKDSGSQEDGDVEGEGGEDDEESTVPPEPVAPAVITVTAKNALLYPMDRKGAYLSEEGSQTLTFEGSGNFAVKATGDPTPLFTINGVRFESAEPVSGFVIKNATSDMTINFQKPKKASASQETPLDYSNMVHVECVGCTFTFRPLEMIQATEGDVPDGAVIIVVPEAGKKLTGGYIVNGEDPVGQGYASYKITVSGNTVITVK